MTRIVLDGMGSDDHPTPELHAAAESARLWADPLFLTGPRADLEPKLRALSTPPGRIQIEDAEQVVAMTDKAAGAARGKSASSMAVGIEMLRDGRADAFVTAGHTGAAMATALLRLGRLRGVKRPALAPTFPTYGGRAIVLDIGANVDCRPEFLVQFAVMGSVYAQATLGIASPRVGLLSNGEEAGKGTALVHEAFPLIEATGLNFVGNVEPKEIYGGKVDVAVTDGFSGNIFLKTSEAAAKFLIDALRDEITAGFVTRAGGALARPAFRRVRRILDPAEYGAVPLLGVNGLVYIGHGRSNGRALVSAIAAARQAVEAGLLPALRRAIEAHLASTGQPDPQGEPA